MTVDYSAATNGNALMDALAACRQCRAPICRDEIAFATATWAAHNDHALGSFIFRLAIRRNTES